MWIYQKKLEFPVNITTPDLRVARALMAQYGGPDSELAAGCRYLTQRFSMPDDRVRATLNDIGTEEIAHWEMIGVMINQSMRNASLDELTEAATAAYAIVTTLPDGPRHWDAFCELIVNRGLSVELVGMGAGLGPQPQVNSPETARQAEVTRRKMAAFIAASNEESAVRQKQPAAIRSNPTQKRD